VPEEGVRDFIEWGFWTGMRKGETSKLTWAMFDRETWTLTIPGDITKNRKGRPIPLVGPLRAIIERRLTTRRLDCAHIFWRVYNGASTKRLRRGDPTRIYEFRKLWDTACKKAGLPGRLYHDFRRTGVRNLTKAGVHRKVAMKISGHKTESVYERYNIDTDEDVRDAVEKLAVYVAALPGDRKVVPISERKATS
jgi:integrase